MDIYRTDLLRDLMYDAYGRKMGVYRDYRYNRVRRYYISNQSEWGRRHGVRRYRTRADELDELVIAAVASLLSDRGRLRSMLFSAGVHDGRLNKWGAAGTRISRVFETGSNRQQQCVLKCLIERIELAETLIRIVIRVPELPRLLQWDGAGLFRGDTEGWNRPHATEVIEIPATTICMKRELTLLLKRKAPDLSNKPNRRLVGLLTKARAAQAVLDERSIWHVNELAGRIGCHAKRFTRLVRLNYLAPDIIASIRDGTQPAQLTCQRLMSVDLPMDWSLQRRLLGFPDQADFLKAAPGW